ncbi:MAG: penicillin-binding protein activator [Gammaproteobacteria bacterium]|nr:penicillin-binding protein activator [Gammaproteobacteria bacterium]
MCYKKYPIIILIVLFLSGCAGFQLQILKPVDEIKLDDTDNRTDNLTPDEIKLDDAYNSANNLASEARYLQASEVLSGTAASLPSPDKEKMQLESARMLIKSQHLLNAHRQLIEIDEQVLETQAVLDKRILTAIFYRQIKQPEKVVALLPEDLIDEGDDALKKEALMLRSDGLKNTHRYIESLTTRINLKKFLDEDEYAENTDEIWQVVVAVDPNDVRTQLEKEVDNRELKAWLELALIATPLEIDATRLEQDYEHWLSKYDTLEVPNYVYEELLERWAHFDFHPEKIALILPLTGDYANIGRTIRDGFLDAQKASQTTSPTTAQKEIQINIYDSNQDPNIVAIYQQAADQGADMVIGPLLKNNTNALLSHSPLTTPIITLNYAMDDTNTADGEVFQFGLYPEDEAGQIAEKLMDEEYNSVVVMAADNEWGERMVRRFSETYRQLEGTIQDVYYYDAEFDDYASSVQSLFHLDRSIQRHADIEQVIRRKLEFKPRIRDDINAAVLFANYQTATLIYPLMKFYYADELPVYASSHAYEPGKEKLLRELDGLIYNDIPFIVNSERYADSEEVKEFPRLYALGKDAYRLINTIRRLAISNAELDGATGYISVDKDRRLHRRLVWAKFNKGKPVALVQE